MNTPTRTFEDKPAVREAVPVLVGLFGPSGGGKTFSALRLATGIQSVMGGDIAVIDTEARRALHYAYDDAAKTGFKFRHLAFGAPFGPLDYLAAIEHFVNKGARNIIVDSMSHEREGPGGVLEMHETEMERLGNNAKMTFLAWQKPKQERRRLINTILQLPANFIFCFRAKEKTKLEKGKDPLPLGFMPIAGEEFVFEMTVNCLLAPHANGVPCWDSDYPGERMMMKLPEQFRPLFSDKKPLDEGIGRTLAEWARGGVEGVGDLQTLIDLGAGKAKEGTLILESWWKSLNKAQRVALKDQLEAWKASAA